ncbi:MAG: DEAD/DEAH box helicase [Opitutaceae bacterium]
MLRIHLPPNLVAAAARDAVAVRVELDLRVAPPAELLPALALLQRWCGPQPPGVLQVNRRQLGELTRAVAGQCVFVEGGQPVAWRHDELLREAAVPAAPAASGPPLRARPRDEGRPLEVDGTEHYLALTLPSREHSQYAEALALVKEAGFLLEPSNGRWWLRDRHRTLSFLARHGARLRGALGARFTPAFTRQTAHLVQARLAAQVEAAGDQFRVELGLAAEGASETELRSALAAGRGYLETKGRVLLLDPELTSRLAQAQQALAGDPRVATAPAVRQQVPRSRVAEVAELLEELAPGFRSPADWQQLTGALERLSALESAPVPTGLHALLRPYQRLGVAWLWHLHRHGLGGILADEMGLGKTLQALAFLAALHRPAAVPVGTTLVVCPASLLENWRREAARFTPELRVEVHHGSGRLTRATDLARSDLLITSYGTLARDQALFDAAEFAAVVADEAQHIKNRRSQSAVALRALRARTRFLLTGTPLENSLADLRSLLEFLLPGYLPRLPAGLSAEERTWHDDRLRRQAAPYLLRRTKRAVAPELPPRLEQVLWVELTPAQSELYRRIEQEGERQLIDLAAAGVAESRLRLAALTQLLRLRQVCCDPRLVTDLPEDPPAAVSAKLEAFRELLAEAVDDGHRLLVFSQFTRLLDLVGTELAAQGIPWCRLDGTMSPTQRQAEVDRFQSEPGVPVFLLSLKAGGTGLNLTAADTVVHLDPWWNPAAEAQATDRAHRIGQTRTVTSYKLIATGTVEERVLALQEEKRTLLAEVFEASDAAAAKLSLADLRGLLGGARS